ncbi:MAG TPA: leucyl aminopeptidase family protein [Bdellovibrionales bacterium]|nr:leucyl aminopeptidase family protein [Bdellovibrionales bacterium]
MFRSPTRWSRAAKLQFSESAKKALKDLTESSKTAELFLKFDAGGEWRGLFVADGIETFALHGGLRKAFEGALKAREGETVRLTLTGLTPENQARALAGFASLTLLCAWKPDRYGKKTKPGAKTVARVEVVTDLPDADVKSITREALALAEGNNLVRTLGQAPSNVLNPASYRKQIETRAKQRKYKVDFYDRIDLTKLGAGAFLAVTQGSLEDEGGIVHLHVPGKGKAKKKLVLVGKGLCFDTGGYNIKTGAYMHGMHKDMLGSAIALAIFETIVAMDWDLEVHAYLALAENLISHRAYRPNDVVTALDGTTIEVVDTDAEGRMVLSDTLALARKQKPDLLIDFATLTGSAIRALDTRRCAVFSPDAELASLAYQVGEACGERTWVFPMGDDFKEGLKSEIADLLQCSHGPNADHSYAATFLHHFAGAETPWLHLDLTAANNKGGLGLVSSETTGIGVRWGYEVAKRYFKDVT